jgi:hypothetical protein
MENDMDDEFMQKAWRAMATGLLITRIDADGTVTILDPNDVFIDPFADDDAENQEPNQ